MWKAKDGPAWLTHSAPVTIEDDDGGTDQASWASAGSGGHPRAVTPGHRARPHLAGHWASHRLHGNVISTLSVFIFRRKCPSSENNEYYKADDADRSGRKKVAQGRMRKQQIPPSFPS